MEKHQALSTVGIAGENEVDILCNTAKCVLPTKEFLVGKLNIFMSVKHLYKDILTLTSVIQDALGESSPVDEDVIKKALQHITPQPGALF